MTSDVSQVIEEKEDVQMSLENFQQYPHGAYLENATGSLMAPYFQHINHVELLGNRQTAIDTHRTTSVCAHASRVNNIMYIPYIAYAYHTCTARYV